MACLALVSVGDVIRGDVPKQEQTFTIPAPGGGIDYVGLRVKGEWIRDFGGLDASVTQVEVVYDTPYLRSPRPAKNVTRRRLDAKPETAVLRKERHKQEWERAGYVFIDTPGGVKPVLQREVDYAYRAREMAAKVEARLAARELDPTVEIRPEEGHGEPLGLIKQWGGHALILLVGLVLVGVILNTTVLAQK